MLFNAILTTIEELGVNSDNSLIAFSLSFALGVLSLMRVLISQQFFSTFVRALPSVKSLVTTAVFDKSLRLTAAARNGLTIGQITNYQNSDAKNIMLCLDACIYLLACVVEVVAYTVMLYWFIGWATFAGIAVIVMSIPINAVIRSALSKVYESLAKQGDERVKLINEMLQGMLGVKMAAWEDGLGQTVKRARQKELNSVWWANFYECASNTIFDFLPMLCAAVAIASYGFLVQGDVRASTIFTAFSIFASLQGPIADVSWLYTQFLKSVVSIQRVSDFLLLDEATGVDSNEERCPDEGIAESTNNAIRITNGTFFWVNPNSPAASGDDDTSAAPAKQSKAKTKLCFSSWCGSSSSSISQAVTDDVGDEADRAPAAALSNITCEVRRGSLTAIIGPVGSGKSSLCNAILGEMYRTAGSIAVSGTVAYAAQTPWILNATLRDNILFGQPYNAERYQEVINVCQLEHDISMLKGGDQTEIGEKGINLSGGQKQRVSVARAAYSSASIVLLDDPLSALDPGVGAKVFHKCIAGLMKGRTVVLVANQLNFLHKCDWIVVLSGSSGLLPNGEDDGIDDDDDVYPDGDAKNNDAATALLGENGKRSSEEEGREERNKKTMGKGGYIAEQGTYADLNDAGQEFARMLHRFTKLHSKVKRQVSGENVPDHKGDNNDENNHNHNNANSNDGSTKDKLIEEEERAEGAVTMEVYRAYVTSGNTCTFMLIALFSLAWQLMVVFSKQWVAFWTEDASNGYTDYFRHHPIGNNTNTNDVDLLQGYHIIDPVDNNTHPDGNDKEGMGMALMYYCGVYVALTFAVFFSMVLMYLSLVFFAFKSSTKTHDDLLASVLRAPMSFFDTTPLGRIVARFSEDIKTLDTSTIHIISWLFQVVLEIASTLVVISYSTPYFLVALPFMAVVYIRTLRIYRPINRELKRLDSTSRSPIFAHFSESLTGLSSIRAFNRQSDFLATASDRINANSRVTYNMRMSECWLGSNLGLMNSTIVTLAGVFAVQAVNAGHLSPSQAGMSLSFSISVSHALNMIILAVAQVEQEMNSYERVRHYTTNIDHEAPSESQTPPNPTWPQHGQIVVKDLKMRYRPDTPLVLKGVSFTVQGGERIGIVGRTGSGKSTLMLALLRLVEPERLKGDPGPIFLDGVDTCTLGLSELRRAISIVPQLPVIFSGTVRSNLDLFNQCTDAQLWAALEKTNLKDLVGSYPDKLQHKVSEGGSNFSQGQTQLLCLARAMLEKSRVLLLDEATSSIDFETDELIQRTIRTPSSFGGQCTVITIAHRINTVIDNDKILVLDAGQVVEYDAPATLLANKSSKLSSMVQQT